MQGRRESIGSRDLLGANPLPSNRSPPRAARQPPCPRGKKGLAVQEYPAPPTSLISILVAIVSAVVVIGPLTGKPPCEVRILFYQKLRRALRPKEERVGVEPDVRVGLNVVGPLLDATDRRQMRRASGVRAAHQSVVDVKERIAGAVGDIRRCDRNVGTASADIARCSARSERGRERQMGGAVLQPVAPHLGGIDLLRNGGCGVVHNRRAGDATGIRYGKTGVGRGAPPGDRAGTEG